MVFVGTLPVVEGGGLVVLAYHIRDGHVKCGGDVYMHYVDLVGRNI